jgi:hypothetical protein
MVEVVITLDFEVLVKNIASLKLCPTSESPRRGYDKSPLKHPQKIPPTWLPPPTIATSHHCPPQFCHAETTVKGTEMGYCNFFAGQNWPLAAAATGKYRHDASTMRRAFTKLVNSKNNNIL